MESRWDSKKGGIALAFQSPRLSPGVGELRALAALYMWFLIIFPVAWLLSEIKKAPRRVRVTAGVFAMAAVAFMAYTSQELEHRVTNHVQANAIHALGRVGREGDTNRVASALAVYESTIRTSGTFRASYELTEYLRKSAR